MPILKKQMITIELIEEYDVAVKNEFIGTFLFDLI